MSIESDLVSGNRLRGSTFWRPTCLLILVAWFSVQKLPISLAVGYSYTRFVGPVRGPEQQVYVTDHKGGEQHLDYRAKPEYEFAYGVEDADARILHNRNEIRDGDTVKGVYSLVDPDGTLRVVKYTADDVNGFKAEVITNGLSTLHGHQTNAIDDYQNNYNDFHYNVPSASPPPTPSTKAPLPINIFNPLLNPGFRPNLDQLANQPTYQPYHPLLIVTTHKPNGENKAQPHYKVHETQEENDNEGDDGDDDDDDDDYDDDDDNEDDDQEDDDDQTGQGHKSANSGYNYSDEEELEDYDDDNSNKKKKQTADSHEDYVS